MYYHVKWVVEIDMLNSVTHYKSFNTLEDAIEFAKDQILSTQGCVQAEVHATLLIF